MPLYEYLCATCGERTEILQRFNDLPEVACPNCGAAMRRLPSAPSIQFKGSGFYLTDYAKKSGGTEGTSPRGGSDKAADKAGEKASEAGPAKSAASAESPAGNSSSGAADSAAPSTSSSKPSAPAGGSAKGPTGGGA